MSDAGGDSSKQGFAHHEDMSYARGNDTQPLPISTFFKKSPEDIGPELESELVSHFQKGVPHSVLSLNLFFAALLIFILWQHLPHMVMLSWFAAEFIVVVANGFLLQAYRNNTARFSAGKWGYILSLGAIANGISWGVGGALLYTPLAPIQSVFVLLAIAGICSGVSTIQGSLRLGFFGLVVPALMIPAITIFVVYGTDHVMASILYGLYLPFISYNAMNNRKSLIETIQLRLEKERLLEDVKQSETYFRTLIENAADLIGVLGFDGSVRFVSPSISDVLGYTVEDIQGKNILELIHPDDRQSTIDSLQQVSNAFNAEIIGERRYVHKNGRLVILESRGKVLDRDQETILVFARDVTERSEMEHELVQAKVTADRASQAKGRFLAHMSHEIRTPMHAILAMSEMLQRTELDKAQLLRVTTLNNAGQHLLSLINDILDFSSFDSGGVKLYAASFDLDQLLSSTFELLKLVAESKPVEFSYKIEDGIERWRYGDAHRIRQILINLLGNALKFTDQGSVSLTLKEIEKDKLVFVIADTGKGIPQDQLEHVFESFTQVASDETNSGTGLGLAITKSLVDAMHGEITAESIVGEGTQFYVSLTVPVSHEPRTEVLCTSTVSSISEALKTVRVLVADDEPINQLVIEDYLQGVVCHLDMVSNGQEAIDQVFADDYDIILMDMRMPVMDGLSATQTIREKERQQGHRPIPIIALSAAVLENERESFINAGCTSFLAKPVNRDALLTEMTRCIG